MAGALVGEAFLSAFIEVVMDRLASPEVASLIRGKKLDKNLLQRLKNTLYAVEAVLNDAEQKQIKDSAVNKWLDDLKDAVYVADDLLDRVSTKGATQKEASNFFSRFLNFQDRDVVSKLEVIVGRLECIINLKDILGLKEIARENMSWRIPSTSLDDGSNVFGRDKDKEAILQLLLDDENGDDRISVIPVVGMGGVGKTTLAQSVYNDDVLKKKFDFQAWVCVSEEFDILRVTKTIIEAISRTPCAMSDMNLLHLDLKEKLTGKKVFVVLDDVWIEDYAVWEVLRRPFQYGIRGSKILLTTRSEKVASIVQTVQPYHLNKLSNEDCWLVFAKHACLSLESGDNMALKKIGREIVTKCKGLPLAAQSLGGLLRTKRDIPDWTNILNSNIWQLSENDNKIIPALRISYHHLPPYLKRCFVYCSLYPKDYEFHKDELILLWMAEDLLQPPKNDKNLVEVGYEYFDYLVSRSFFQRSNTRKEYFVMHDLVHDLATLLGGEFYFRSEELGKETKISIKTRHLSFSRFKDPVAESFECFGGVKSLRTFLPINFKMAPFNNEKAPCIVLSNFKYPRVLSFYEFLDLDVLPDSIGELIHLRHLNLSSTGIKTLPESLCNLHNLQTLSLGFCRRLTMLPIGLPNLVSLRHLDTRDTELKEMPRGMGKLNHLQHLSDFIVGKHEDNGIKELGKLSNLQGRLQIAKLENVTNGTEALEARMMDKEHLNQLRLSWSAKDDFFDSRVEMDILHKLRPHQNLKFLCIFGYRGTRFPDWVGHSSYHNMTELVLTGCKNCCMLPSLGRLPALEYLRIGEMEGLETIGVEFFKNDESFTGTPFPSLEHLIFHSMPCWEVWHPFESESFPRLKMLEIHDCPKLRGALPTHLPSLVELSIDNCEQLASSLPRATSIRKLKISKSNEVTLQELPLSVEHLTICGSQMTESVFEAISKTPPTSLQSLIVDDCSSALSLFGDWLPASLMNLEIRNSRKLKLELPKQYQHKLLETLAIRSSCDSLTSLPLDAFPNLTSLSINDSENLECVYATAALQNVRAFYIYKCPKLVSFPREGLLAPNMTHFELFACYKLKSLPCHMKTFVPKLESLSIRHCPEIESFPEGGMPPNLRMLDIVNCEKLLRNPSLASMDMLTELRIGVSFPKEELHIGVSFPKEGLVMLPSSLASLYLYSLSSLETLECKGLLHLTSLQQLSIRDCPKLENIDGERLPTSLIKLEIYNCPLLEGKCQMKHPQIWPKISHIRGIRVKYRWIS